MKKSHKESLAGLPPVPPGDLRPAIRAGVAAQAGKLVVLDDDPTGTQTVYDVPVLTRWDVETLKAEFRQPHPCFYILTNSRSLCAADARELNLAIAQNLAVAAGGNRFSIVSRSDSTLRGHYPLETDVLNAALGPYDATFLVPYFEAGGRYTLEDVHYVAEGDVLTPAAETPFARDAVFGYTNSNLRAWVEEKTGGRIRAAEVQSLSIAELREPLDLSACALTKKLLALPPGGVCVVNAAHPGDLDRFALATLEAEHAGRKFIYRTAAQFVAARLGLEPRPLLGSEELIAEAGHSATGGLVVAGSYVPKTTEQLAVLREGFTAEFVEAPVEQFLEEYRRPALIERLARQVESVLAAGRHVVLYTSRQLVTARELGENLAIAACISQSLVDIVRALRVRPRFLVAKGGITSSDVATQGLKVLRAMVRGQIIPGVPVWRLGSETRFPGMNYVVFPGNVGGPDALLNVCQKLCA